MIVFKMGCFWVEWDNVLLTGMTFFIVGRFNSHWDDSLYMWDDCLQIQMILLIMGLLSSNWNDYPFSGIIIFNLGKFSVGWDDCLQMG